MFVDRASVVPEFDWSQEVTGKFTEAQFESLLPWGACGRGSHDSQHPCSPLMGAPRDFVSWWRKTFQRESITGNLQDGDLGVENRCRKLMILNAWGL